MSKMQSDKIKDYFRGKMSPFQRRAFEIELEKNSELKAEYLIYKTIHTEIRTMSQISEAISDPNLNEAFKLADEAINEYTTDNTKAEGFDNFKPHDPGLPNHAFIKTVTMGVTRKLYLYVSSAAALLLMIFLFRFSIFQIDPDKLFDQYYSPASMAINNTRGGTENLNASLILAYKYYDNKEYVKSDSVLSILKNDTLDHPVFWYLQGLIDMERNNYQLAITSLKNNLSEADAFYLEKQWYLSLCYLKLGEIDNARSSLIIIQQFPNAYQSDAKLLFRKLRRLPK